MLYQKVNSSIVPQGTMNSFKEMFPLARMFPLAVMHRKGHLYFFLPRATTQEHSEIFLQSCIRDV